ncbi:helix-turn-helix transcriptional regulator [Providencia alcalifaciens]|uniref:helix-turn-helix transcriptional regulator n=1 Tax=Providencia alcalifaciens TaxID=126385 RepID=UPI0032DBA2BD
MSIHDPIDLDAIKQAVFRKNLPDFLKHVYFWMITDLNNHVLSCSSPENVNSILNSQKIQQATNGFTLSSIELVIPTHGHIAIALEVISYQMLINNQLVILKIYNMMKNKNIKFRIFHANFFIRDDRFNNKLDFLNSIERLKYKKPWESLTDHEWAVAWLVIHRLTNPEISNAMDKSINTIKSTVSRILGIYKLELYDRNLLSDVGLYLNWDCYVPLSLIKNTV